MIFTISSQQHQITESKEQKTDTNMHYNSKKEVAKISTTHASSVFGKNPLSRSRLSRLLGGVLQIQSEIHAPNAATDSSAIK